jgi:hypothetical protein
VKRLAYAALLALAALGCAARAADRSVSYSTWIISPSERTVTLRYVVPTATAEQLTGTAIPVLTVSKLGDYLLGHAAVYTAAGQCPASDQGYDLGRVDPLDVGRGLYGFELVFRCARPLARLALENRALFDRDPGHVDFARIEVGRRFTQELFTAGRERLSVAAAGPLPSASSDRYVRLGWLHVVRSPLRLGFLLVALLLVRRVRDLAALLGALAAGYVLSGLLQAGGWVLPRPPLVEGFIGFLVALLAVRIALSTADRSRIVRAGWPALLLLLAAGAVALRTPQAALLLVGGAICAVGFLRMHGDGPGRSALWLPAGLYGLFDGLLLPALLAPLHLTAAARAPMLIGYDAGALLADATLAGLLAAGAFALARVGYLDVVRPAVHEAAGACLTGLGTFWLLTNAARTIPATPVGKSAPSIAQTLAHVDRTTANPDSLLMRNYYLMGNTLIPMSQKPKD